MATRPIDWTCDETVGVQVDEREREGER